MKPSDQLGHDSQRGEILERIQKEYGKPEEKQREAVKKLGKDEFFRIMVNQIQNQDPMKPYQNEQMAAQMAQFTALEQMLNMNQNLEKLSQAQTPLQQLGASHLIGKYVTTDTSRIFHTEGKYSETSVDLPTDASKLRVLVMNDRGETVQEMEKFKLKKGENKIEWNGKKSNGLAAASGQYYFRFVAESESGKNIPVQTTKTAYVHGIAFEKNETVLLTGDVKKPQKFMLKNVSKIVDSANAAPKNEALMGLQIPGLTEGAIAPTQEQMQAQIGAEEKNIEDYQPEIQGKYMPVDMKAMRKAQEKPEVQEALSNDQIRKMLAEGPDLSAANPNAEAIMSGKGMPETNSVENTLANKVVRPAQAVQANSVQRNAMPSGEEGSTVGQWLNK